MATIYVDGAISATVSGGSGLAYDDPAQPFTVGSSHYFGGYEGYVSGTMADLRVYDAALSEADIASLSMMGAARSTPVLVYDALATPTTILDSSGNGNDGTV